MAPCTHSKHSLLMAKSSHPLPNAKNSTLYCNHSLLPIPDLSPLLVPHYVVRVRKGQEKWEKTRKAENKEIFGGAKWHFRCKLMIHAWQLLTTSLRRTTSANPRLMPSLLSCGLHGLPLPPRVLFVLSFGARCWVIFAPPRWQASQIMDEDRARLLRLIRMVWLMLRIFEIDGCDCTMKELMWDSRSKRIPNHTCWR